MLFFNLSFALYFLITILTLVFIVLIDNVNAEVNEMKIDEHDREDLNDHQRRMLEAIEDRDWHVSHLKGVDLDKNCEDECSYQNTIAF